MTPLHEEDAGDFEVAFSDSWDLLGPFQIGTREATWGADPLEYLGGFRSLLREPNTTYHSSLAPDGFVKWASLSVVTHVSGADSVAIELAASFPNIEWEVLRSIYGWAALQYQAWARGNLIITADSPLALVLYTDNVLEFWLDGQPVFGGDFFAYRKAPVVFYLEPGSHKIDVRLIRDVRAMGGAGEPEICIKIEAQRSVNSLALTKDVLAPDIVDGNLAGSLASVSIRNEARNWIKIKGIECLDGSFDIVMAEHDPINVAPGQSKPLVFRVSMASSARSTLSLKVSYILEGYSGVLYTGPVSYDIPRRSIQVPHKFTYMLPSGIVSYSILRPPSSKMSLPISNLQSLPILVNLHGAGLKADSSQVRHMLDALPDLHAWVLFPSGVTPWSGDDWHVWGFADVLAAISAIPEWIRVSTWKGPRPDLNSWLVSGHSNGGGQGAWHALTHHPDKIIGGAPVSSYSSIQPYVPYTFWTDVDPKVNALLQSSLADYRHELLVENLVGIPILQQHSSIDDNVPVYHSRKMSQIISQSNGSSCYKELSDQKHWFDGAMSTLPLRNFYNKLLECKHDKPKLSRSFSVVAANPASMTTRGGISIDQLISPNQPGKLRIEQTTAGILWTLTSSNILRFHFSTQNTDEVSPSVWLVDGCRVNIPENSKDAKQWLLRSIDGSWHVSNDSKWQSIAQRFGRQLGPLDSILRSHGKFVIYSLDDGQYDIALQISRNLFQYFGADAEIITSKDILGLGSGNTIRIELGTIISPFQLPSYPINIEGCQGLTVRNAHGYKKVFRFEAGLGAIFLEPLPSERLQMRIWGWDIRGLRQAARLLPMLTGVGQPEFVVVSQSCSWLGAGGVKAMGSFDSFWNISETSFMQ